MKLLVIKDILKIHLILHVDYDKGEITVKFNNKNLIIKKTNSINLNDNGFNFPYLLEKTNSYCMLSGDSSYMEALTLNKIVIHVGIDNKYVMINELNLQIINKIDFTKFKSIKNYETDIDKLQITNLDNFNKNLKLYSELLSNPLYLEKQKELTELNFDDSIINEIGRLTSRLVITQKYLKYKIKYLVMRDTLTNSQKKTINLKK